MGLDGRPTTRVAVVTGAAQGIGRRVSETLAAEGYALVLADLREPTETLAAVRRAAVPGTGDGDGDGAAGEGDGAATGAGAPRAVALTGDVADAEYARRLTDEVRERFGRVDVLVNNAGVSLLTPAEETTAEQWRRVLEVNLTGPFLLSQALGRLMLAAGSGAIVNIASIAGLHGVADRAAYNTSKHGLIGLTRTLAAEWGGRGVRVNAVCPGWVKTEMDAADQASGGYTDDDITDRVPMGRFAVPGDIAAAVSFLADPARSGFVNGVALPVDGGWTADASWTSLRLRKR
ncbi:SDR family NAD(P)-dependent oxidoreductase [Allostreptomyces psammosilenae]|uniref:NAD(P)-dependent dehydrogenase (Short-subunit alcohol dehydrogenase family) n=1 Tax=Allostreptomyces psammosilenae TaxID=1892865 RepID=A0A852ZVZ6_9ACTN|nr:SDR family oxidoreductase [Allostreptomyces psammosilenae]NYI06399.1 NAD(P)-dependent dehydrogenase (short-subunit alcohol dehydrogenase family) [Allostreptomyces psammosilenae]